MPQRLFMMEASYDDRDRNNRSQTYLSTSSACKSAQEELEKAVTQHFKQEEDVIRNNKFLHLDRNARSILPTEYKKVIEAQKNSKNIKTFLRETYIFLKSFEKNVAVLEQEQRKEHIIALESLLSFQHPITFSRESMGDAGEASPRAERSQPVSQPSISQTNTAHKRKKTSSQSNRRNKRPSLPGQGSFSLNSILNE